ncbi:hypothetical protein CS542_02150 [Pedobacter sp. IW39]|nr:hypothetical protein CS542_02150 [Pedobacter sp. IW39]
MYNAYGRENAYAITFRDNPDDRSRTQAVQTSLFRFVPSFLTTLNFKMMRHISVFCLLILPFMFSACEK